MHSRAVAVMLLSFGLIAAACFFSRLPVRYARTGLLTAGVTIDSSSRSRQRTKGSGRSALVARTSVACEPTTTWCAGAPMGMVKRRLQRATFSR